MTDFTARANTGGEDPAEVEAREARHQVLIELLGAYADRELPAETTSQIDAHLVGCARCRSELRVHTSIRRRLEAEPPMAASPALRDRVAAAIAATPVPEVRRERRPGVAWLLGEPAWLLGGALLVIALVGVTWWISIREPRTSVPPIAMLAASGPRPPIVDSIVADYRRVMTSDLPGRSRDLETVRAGVPFAVEPLRAPALRLLGAWTTVVCGEPAAVLAYRDDDRVVLEYLVSEDRFFQPSAIRGGIAGGHVLAMRYGAQSVVAWPTAAAGAFLVGDMPPEALAALAAPDALARKGVGGAP